MSLDCISDLKSMHLPSGLKAKVVDLVCSRLSDTLMLLDQLAFVNCIKFTKNLTVSFFS